MQYIGNNIIYLVLLLLFTLILIFHFFKKLKSFLTLSLSIVGIVFIIFVLLGFSNSLAILNFFNYYQGIAQWLILLVAIITVWYARNTFFMQGRPYVDIEFSTQINQINQDWNFFASIKNKGAYPGIVKISSCELKIGDERYPSSFVTTFILYPGESKVSPHIGTINQTGRNKIKTNSYVSNTVEISLEVLSKELSSKEFKYKTRVKALVDVSSSEPSFHLIENNLS